LLNYPWNLSERQTIDRVVCVFRVVAFVEGATMRFRKVMVFLVAFWVIGALNATNASAQFRLRIEDLDSYDSATNMINAVVITDDGIGDDAVGAGAMQFNLFGFGAGNAVTSLTFSWSKPFQTGPSNSLQSLFLNSVTMSTSSSANIRLTLEDSGFINRDPVTGLPLANGPFQLTSHVIDGAFAGSPGSAIGIQSWVNTSNNMPSLGADAVSSTSMTALDPNVGNGTVPAQVLNPSDSLAGTPDGIVGFNTTGPYSLWTQVTFNLVGASQIQFNQDAFVTPGNGETLPDGSPEPASLMLISTGLVGLAGARRRQLLGMLGRA